MSGARADARKTSWAVQVMRLLNLEEPLGFAARESLHENPEPCLITGETRKLLLTR
jgi:hypothetical protein